MKKMLYQQLTDFLLTHLPQSYKANFYSWMENGKLINEGKQVTETGIEIAQLDYQAVLFFENLPFKEINPYELLALIQVWINEQDYYQFRDFETPFDIEMIDDVTAELTVTISFKEPITAEKDPTGKLLIAGERYKFDEINISVVEQIELGLNGK
ncbi:phage tail protein [Ursidibacter sp. B-7004-1]